MIGIGRFGGRSRVVKDVKGKLVVDKPWRMKGRSRRRAVSDGAVESVFAISGPLSSDFSVFLLGLW